VKQKIRTKKGTDCPFLSLREMIFATFNVPLSLPLSRYLVDTCVLLPALAMRCRD